MKKIDGIIKKVKQIDTEYLLKELFLMSGFKEMIIKLNTDDQLYNHGVDSLGRILGNYSPYTVAIKQEKGQRYDHVTLNDTGEFYDSFRVVRVGTSIKITAETMKEDNDLIQVWGKDILGLTDENLQKVIDAARIFLVPRIKEKILRQAA